MNNNEIWKKTKYDGYLVSNYGRVMSIGHPDDRYRCNYDRILSPADNGRGYLFVNINGKQKYIHRLVAETFIENPNNYPEVNHKNENKNDNYVGNLEWCDKKYNVSYSLSIKVKQIDPITKEVIAIFDSANQAAKSINGNNHSILQCCKRIKYNTYKGYIWRFINDNDYTVKGKYIYVRINLKNYTITEYDSCELAAKENKVSVHAIYNCILGKSKKCKGYAWTKRRKIY